MRWIASLIFLLVINFTIPVYPKISAESRAEKEFVSIQEFAGKKETDPKRAIRKYRKLVKRFPKTNTAAGAQYEIAKLLEKIGENKKACQAYIVILENYSGSEWFTPAMQNLYRIGLSIFRTKQDGIFKNSYDNSHNVFEKLLEAAPYSEYAAEIQYKCGICSMKLGDFPRAGHEFQKVIKSHPQEPWLAKSMYQLGECYFEQSLPANRDQAATDKGISQFLKFKAKYPGSSLINELDEKLKILKDKKAKNLYLKCLHYWKRKEKTAFTFYLQKLNSRYPDSEWAKEAEELLKEK